MGIITRKDKQPLLIDGQESRVLTRKAADDEAEGWSIVSRPYRNRPQDNLLDNLGSSSGGDSTCILAGNRVLMADGSTMPIEAIKVGDAVMTMSGPAKVMECETTRLGMARKMIELRGIGDECLMMTDDHPLWVRRTGRDGASVESWGTYNVHQTMYEMRQAEPGSAPKEIPVPLNFDLPEQVAHRTGWLHVRPIFHHVDPDTVFYHLVVDSGFSYIAEGFPLLSHCLYAQGPSAPWTGLSEDSSVQAFLDRLHVEA